jgi:methionyl-tRNA formyltransferase
MEKKNASVLFLGKAGDAYVEKAVQFCQMNFTNVTAHLGEWGDPLPDSAASWSGDYIISYLSRWVVPAFLLEKAKIAAFNFHPASPDYPGIGCNNFALYEDATEYGVTCHHMAAMVDTGKLIAVKRFPVFPTDNVASILARTYDHQIVLFYEVLGMILNDQPLPVLEETWTRKPFSRKEFNQLRQITPDMTAEEIARRIRATAYGEWQPWVEIEGYVFSLRAQGKE